MLSLEWMWTLNEVFVYILLHTSTEPKGIDFRTTFETGMVVLLLINCMTLYISHHLIVLCLHVLIHVNEN